MPGTGYLRARARTSAWMVSSSAEYSLSFSSEPASTQISATFLSQSARVDISSIPNPRVVMAGVPRRTPEGRKAPPLSVGMALALRVRPTMSRAFS